MEIFEDTISVAGGFDSAGEAVKSIEVYDKNGWTDDPSGMSLNLERGRFIKDQVSKDFIKIPSWNFKFEILYFVTDINTTELGVATQDV